MEFFRWILIATGIVLLGVAFLMGRKTTPDKIPGRVNRGKAVRPAGYDPAIDELRVPVDDPLNNNLEIEPAMHSSAVDQPVLDQQVQSHQATEYAVEQADNFQPASDYGRESVASQIAISDDFEEVDIAIDEEPYSDQPLDDSGSFNKSSVGVTSFASAVKAASAQEDTTFSDDYANDFSEEFETYHEPVQLEEFEEKLVSIHVVALSGRRFYGNDLKALFERHGYTFGRMSIYHCKLEDEKVFSIANMIKPGTFNEDEMRTFETPGITLFMRLPVNLDSDVAFDFLIREAKELAEELDGQLRDGNRNPLSEQTIQHMREDIQQYVFRTRRVLQPVT